MFALAKGSNPDMKVDRLIPFLIFSAVIWLFTPFAGLASDNAVRTLEKKVVETRVSPQGFVYLKEIIPEVSLEMRYYTANNFIGERIDGYLSDHCILTLAAALALQKVQQDLKQFGLGLKIFDAYRPQSAVDHFIRWAKDRKDTRMKTQYYPEVDKKNLFKDGYIAARSSHSRGSTADLTIIDLETKVELDMGSGFDFFGPISWPSYPNLTAEQRANRMLLRKLMDHHGFEPYDQEWWHFTLRNEPFPDQYFNFPVK